MTASHRGSTLARAARRGRRGVALDGAVLRGPVERRRWAAALAVLVAFVLSLVAPGAAADEVQVAVAANFAVPMQQIAAEFARDTGYTARISSGATGSLAAQIENGAPFDVLLAADEATPARLESKGLVVAGSRFTYAVGRLVLWSPRPGLAEGGAEVLRRGAFAHLAIANPKLAPYGAAAIEVLRGLGLADALRPKIVEGESIAQAAQFVSSGNAELGFVALSQVTSPGRAASGSTWIVPGSLYTPIRQQAALLARAASRPAARALREYLRGPKAVAIIRSYGYALDDAKPPTASR